MTEILPKVHKSGDVGGAPNDGTKERSIRAHQQAQQSKQVEVRPLTVVSLHLKFCLYCL